ncbi:multidrug ABC transporter ATP-binding protein [Candidatus Roizmanbacteria bacterium CG03_land_8_20_14_0_80_36_21]|uniref:Multidrug ABC transporter ATP-binding protein n=2 Tax=Candidatus Roizmaniibacteriota TaxID=1752723 RepID=A0A2M8KLK6_9BACT|nr:MAG: multidrug ABC transporter ATP-binding protein [Candidatus Roizmanbacteria bacterium CG03_land_8_20_14_0_80_36_21]PJC81784.1 MAG: multidrug ABC transporter ATP-binding protein [Candidatus Roizmanbacteria bacterium CG_4_8_14_3_um_filter_36_10]PJE60807.1 MAG: multidrug ABC transporter ATP-binding protein [Candidatus Roizmanbacteria bacterium CG10_big_fil_rev_8_21_14_0_10_36_26]
MISSRGVTKKFKDKIAVDNVSFQFKEGEIIGFVGPNGAGKTTTMRLFLGYLWPTTGQISIDGLNPISNRIEVLKKIGYLPENNPLYQEMRVKEYLQFIAEAKEDQNFSKIISQVGLEEVLNSKIEELSRGFKQRVGLTAAIIGDPQILILDEPTSGLDPIEQDKIKKLIKGLKKTIIFSTHILSEVEDVAGRIVIINQGKIVYDGKKPKGKGTVEKLFKRLIK